MSAHNLTHQVLGRRTRLGVVSIVNPLRLVVFPGTEIALIVLAWRFQTRSLWLFAACILFGAMAHSYSLHIVFHEVVHRRYFRHPSLAIFFESLISIVLGTPFSEYQQSHWRHHRYTNLIEDVTCTWALTRTGIRPRRFWSYSLGWPAMSVRSIRCLLRERRAGQLSGATIARIYYQNSLLIVLQLALLFFAPRLWLAYALTIYFGYVGIAAINYLQHPPRKYGSGYTTTLAVPVYNAIFYNNGLHFEHHERMQVPVIELKRTSGSGRVYTDRLDGHR